MTPAQKRVLEAAAKRERGNICPTVGIHANAQTMLLRALQRAGWATHEVVPKITQNGRAAVQSVP